MAYTSYFRENMPYAYSFSSNSPNDKMRTKNVLLVMLIIGLTSYLKKEKETTIHGQLVGLSDPESIEYTVPINGKWFYGNKQSMTLDSTGQFQIEMEIDQPSFTTLYIPRKAGGVLLIEPGKTYDVTIDVETDHEKFLVTSQDSIGQHYYNSLPLPDFHISMLNEFQNDSIPSAISSKIKALKEKELSRLNELVEQGEISPGFYALATLDRECYYLALEANVACMLLYRHVAQKDLDDKNKAKNYWSKKLDIVKLTESDYTRSPWHYALATNLIRFSQYSSENFNPEALRKIYESGHIYQYNIDQAKKYLSGEELEYYLASYIFFEELASKGQIERNH